MPVTITEVRSTERFVGTAEQPRQVLHVTIERSMRDGEIRLEVAGAEPRGSVFASDVRGALTVPAGDRAVRVDVPLDLPERAGIGDEIPVRVTRDRATPVRPTHTEPSSSPSPAGRW